MKNKQAYIWGLIGKVAPQAINIITNIILARYLTPKEFGMVGVLAIFISISMTFTDSGLGGSLVKEDNISKKDCQTVFTFNLTISLFFYLLMFIFADAIEQFFNVKGLDSVIRWIALVFILNAICIVPKSIMMRNLKFRELTLISIGSYIGASVIAMIGCYLDWGVYTLIAYQLSNVAFNALCINIISRQGLSCGFSMESFKRLFSFGAFTTICNIIDSVYDNIMSILFGKYVGMNTVGYYDQAKKIETCSSNSIVTTINSVSFPILTRLKDAKDDFINEANSLFETVIVYIIPVLFVIAIYSTEIIAILFGQKWLDSAPILRLLMINGGLFVCESLVRNNIKSLGMVRPLANITIIKRGIGIGIILCFLLISGYAMLYGLIISTAIGFLMNTWLYCKLLNNSFRLQLYKYMIYMVYPLCVSLICLLVTAMFSQNIILTIIFNSIVLGVYYYCQIKKLKSNKDGVVR